MIDLNQIELLWAGAWRVRGRNLPMRRVFFWKPEYGSGTFYYYFRWGYWRVHYNKHFERLPKADYFGQPSYKRTYPKLSPERLAEIDKIIQGNGYE